GALQSSRPPWCPPPVQEGEVARRLFPALPEPRPDREGTYARGGCRLMHTADRIYLDHQATTPVDRRVVHAMLPAFTELYGNAASRDHAFGLEAKRAVDEARRHVAVLIGADEDEVIFTSGATEADNLAVLGVLEEHAERGDHLVTVRTEHKAILDAAREAERRGKRVTYLDVDSPGL